MDHAGYCARKNTATINGLDVGDIMIASTKISTVYAAFHIPHYRSIIDQIAQGDSLQNAADIKRWIVRRDHGPQNTQISIPGTSTTTIAAAAFDAVVQIWDAMAEDHPRL